MSVRDTTGVIIPSHEMAPGAILRAVENASSVVSTTSNDAGEYWAMQLVASIPADAVPEGSIIILPLTDPFEGEPLDFTYLASSKHMFLRILAKPQPRLTYGLCVTYSDGTLERLVPLGTTIKFPSVANYLVAKPELVELMRLAMGPELRIPTGDTSTAKRVCIRPLETGGERAEATEERHKGTSLMVDLEGVQRSTRNKADLHQRELDLHFVFRAMDVEKWDYSMSTDLVLTPEAYRSMVCEQAISQTEDQHPAFTACGLISRVQSLPLFLNKEKLKLLLTGAVFMDESNEPTLTWADFVTKESITDEAAPCPNHNSGMVCVLKNLAIVMQVIFSNSFENSLAPFINHLEGAKRIMEVVPADFLKHSVELGLKKFFRVVRSVRSIAIKEMAVPNPERCAAYLTWIFERLAEDLSNHPKMVKQEAYYRCHTSRNKVWNGVVKNGSRIGKAEKPSVKFTEKATEDKGAPSKPCAGYMGSQLGAVRHDGRPYQCIRGAACSFRHISITGKSDQRLTDLTASMPPAAQTDLRKAISSRK